MRFNRYTLSDLVTIKYGKNQSKVVSDKGEIPIYGTGGLMGFATESLYDKPSVLIGRKGTIGKVKYVDHPFWTVDTLFYTIVNTELVIPKYLYYLMSLLDLNNYNEGTTIPSLRTETLNRLEFVIPSLEEQEIVLSFINPIDEKIKTNSEINNNLEQQANLIFDELVGRLIPTISDPNSNLSLHEIGSLDVLITDYVANGSFKSLADNVQYLSQETDNVLIRLTDYNNNFSSDMVYISNDSYDFLSKSKLYGDEIIISNVGANVGTVFRCPRLNKRMSLAPNAIMLRSAKYEHYLYLYFISRYGQQQLRSIVTGSAQPKFNKTNFRSLKVVLPDEETLSKITTLYIPMYEHIVANLHENKVLAEMRDSLLPKMMSGKLNVSDIDF